MGYISAGYLAGAAPSGFGYLGQDQRQPQFMQSQSQQTSQSTSVNASATGGSVTGSANVGSRVGPTTYYGGGGGGGQINWVPIALGVAVGVALMIYLRSRGK